MIIPLLLASFLAAAPDTAARQPRLLPESELIAMEAQDHHEAFEFEAALESWERALAHTRDTVAMAEMEKEMTLSRNGLAMSDFCVRPRVEARRRFSRSTFFSAYPIPEGGVVPADSLRLPGDTLLVLFPIRNGEWLYFSSDALYGVGGYDLYRCRRTADGGWSRPENLGFPYSSPDDDFLYFNTLDGKHTLFASSRGCEGDSVNVYVLEYELNPVREKISDPAALRALCKLEPAARAAVELTARQKAVLGEWRAATDTLASHQRQLGALRRRYSEAPAVEKQFLGSEISNLEMGLPALLRRQKAAEALMQKEGIKEPAVSGWSW